MQCKVKGRKCFRGREERPALVERLRKDLLGLRILTRDLGNMVGPSFNRQDPTIA